MTRFAIIGAGAIGGWFGARLQASGQDVTFVARGDHLARIRSHGLTLRSTDGFSTVEVQHATDDIEAIGEPEFVLVTVKLWDTEAVAAQLAKTIRSDATVISLQNGIDKDDLLRAHLPRGSVLGGACYISTQIVEPGVIYRDAPMERIVLGEYGQRTSDRATRLVSLLTDAGVAAAVSPEIERTLWEKFVFLVGLSGVTALTRLPIGVICSDPLSRELLADVMGEVVQIGQARGVNLEKDFVEDRLRLCDTLPAGMASSMYHDLQHGHRLELDWLSGRVTRLGQELSINTPVNSVIARALSPYAQGRR